MYRSRLSSRRAPETPQTPNIGLQTNGLYAQVSFCAPQDEILRYGRQECPRYGSVFVVQTFESAGHDFNPSG